jgi:leucyl-tRNA synthetase
MFTAHRTDIWFIGKAALKTLNRKYQFQIMMGLGIPQSEIRKFADARYWLHYFPQIWQQHLTDMGCAIDWRRSFVTTYENPYYDSFVRWQITRLKELGKIRFGKRYTVYSPKDGQPCLDHDRSEGEAVQVQEYAVLKCQVKQWSESAERALRSTQLSENSKVYLVPATLRPETMYGQTNLFVSPEITYGIYHISDSEYFLMTDHAARNMAYQNIFLHWGEYRKAAQLKGSDIIGTLVSTPLSRRQEVYVIPMSSIKETKGTGVVASVPSDSPDDYVMTKELAKKASHYNIKAEWVSLDILPIIETPDLGNLIAPCLVEQMKINSPKDVAKLTEAKEQAYKLGFYHGKMIFGEFSGKPVQEAKPLLREKLLNSGEAIVYCEPDGRVTSRSGDECVVAYVDQWYLNYGESDAVWQADVLAHVSGKDDQNFNSFSSATKNAIEHTLGWISEWCVTRQYGLGTKLPWDETQLVEGLSDSTIYMAYYTIAHYLHSDIYGTEPGIGSIKASQMTYDVWDFVFALADKVDSDIDQSTLDGMRREFTYWYPLDIRVSGKDLANNHLIFFLYIHQAIWGQTAPQYLPKGIRLNGHLTLNGDKMSKSTGNFLTLEDSIKKFGADATRLALADGSDGMEDSNFEEAVANSFVLKLYELRKWIEDMIRDASVVKDASEYRTVCENRGSKSLDAVQRSGERSFWDNLFENQVNTLVHETIKHFKALVQTSSSVCCPTG